MVDHVYPQFPQEAREEHLYETFSADVTRFEHGEMTGEEMTPFFLNADFVYAYEMGKRL